MSFSQDVKQEIVQQEFADCCERALLSSFLQINAHLLIVDKKMQLQIMIANAAIAKLIYRLLKKRYDLEMELTVNKKARFHKHNSYGIRVLDKGREILEDLGIYSVRGPRQVPYSYIVVKACDARSYLCGAFLAAGSINAPSSANYHLEIAVDEKELADFILKLLGKFDITAKIATRRGKNVVYIKIADQIADFLKVVGAYRNTMIFEDVRIQRDFKNSLTRLDNCELANEVKTIQAGNKHLDAIYALIEHNRYSQLDPKLIEVCDLRMNYPEASLNELIEHYYLQFGQNISKSGLQHRFKKVLELAEKLS